MCGIVGYVGWRDARGILLEGLERLEYRGYDSAGLALVDGGAIRIVRCEGKLERLRALVEHGQAGGRVGIGHTRWATHGRPSEANAHPHSSGDVAIVHNGIIENYAELARELAAQGCRFLSETDSEVLCHLFGRYLRQGYSLVDAVRAGLLEVRGSFAVAVVSVREPDVVVVARQESPLIVGVGQGESFVASDVPAILPYTREMMFLENGDLAVLRAGEVEVMGLDGRARCRSVRVIDWDPVQAEKGGYAHFMLKEIYEQPRAVLDTLRGRVDVGQVRVELDGLEPASVAGVARVVFAACGTSYYASLVGKFILERLAQIPVEVDLASEFRYREPLVGPETLVVLVSQSGETADTLGALREAKRRGARTLGICNVVESSLARECDHVLYTHAGPEIGVASTKAFTSQLAALFLVGLALGTARGRLGAEASARYLQGLLAIPSLIERTLELDAAVRALADSYAAAGNFLYLGRGPLYPIALEGALKLKEVSYIHAEGCPAGEIKHGPIALIDRDMPVVVLVQRDQVYEKILSNMQEVRAREGRIIAVADDTASVRADLCDHLLSVPSVDPLLMPFVMVVPLQLFAYYVACARGLDVDKPRNLAKSVTVE